MLKKHLVFFTLSSERINPLVASLYEGLKEKLTLHRLKVPIKLSVRTTNPPESPFAFVQEKTHQAKSLRGGEIVAQYQGAQAPAVSRQNSFPKRNWTVNKRMS